MSNNGFSLALASQKLSIQVTQGFTPDDASQMPLSRCFRSVLRLTRGHQCDDLELGRVSDFCERLTNMIR